MLHKPDRVSDVNGECWSRQTVSWPDKMYNLVGVYILYDNYISERNDFFEIMLNMLKDVYRALGKVYSGGTYYKSSRKDIVEDVKFY